MTETDFIIAAAAIAAVGIIIVGVVAKAADWHRDQRRTRRWR